MYNKEEITQWFMSLQDEICQKLEIADGKSKFIEDSWKRKEGGGGKTRVLTQGKVIEKGGVAFSAVHGKTPEKILRKLQLSPSDFYATGVSIVIHPLSPMVPIIHMNVRYFEMNNGTCWFGGGIDLTPHYVDVSNAQYFHHELKKICDRHHPAYYSRFKSWADDYFYIKHRHEMRGVGGIFFDHLSPTKETSLDEIFHFVQDVGRAFAPIYTYLIHKNQNLSYGEKEKSWQFVRRGRYAEFNLVLDKGTKFGLETQGRIESILMSLPPQANWHYNYLPNEGSRENETLQYLKKGINWLESR